MSNANFSFMRDFSQIQWKQTLWLNFLRAAFAGPVIMLFMTLSGDLRMSEAAVYLLSPVMYIVGALPCGLLFQALLDMSFIKVLFPIWLTVFLMRFVFGLFVTLGDPFVFLLQKIKTQWVTVPIGFKILNFALILFILKSPEA